MFEINYLSVVTGTIAAFVIGAVWNGALFGNLIMKLRGPGQNLDSGNLPIWKLLTELVRCFIVTLVLAYLIMQLGAANWIEALKVGVLIWFGFPAMILLGAVIWEDVPLKLAAIHAGDWLIKTSAMAVIISAWF